jgi:hypothetical protein
LRNLQGTNSCCIETCKWAAIIETCSQLCENVATVSSSSGKSDQRIVFFDDALTRNSKKEILSAKRTATLSKSSSVLEIPRNRSITDLRSIPCTQSNEVASNFDAKDKSSTMQTCYSVNGIDLRDLEAFEAQLLEVQDVKTTTSIARPSNFPITKVAILGSKSANALTEKRTMNNSRLSLSFGSKLRQQTTSATVKVSDGCDQCQIDLPQPVCDMDALCLTKVISTGTRFTF